MALVRGSSRLNHVVDGDVRTTEDCTIHGALQLGTMASIALVAGSSDTRSSDSRPFPELPAEILILVFEHAARESRATAASLALVSQFSRATVLPLLFCTLVLQQRTAAYALLCFLHEHPHIAVHVRHVWMRRGASVDAALLLLCEHLERIAVPPSCLNTLFYSEEIIASFLVRKFPEGVPKRTLLCSPCELLLFSGHINWLDFERYTNIGYRQSFLPLPCIKRLWLRQASQLRGLLECGGAVAALSRLTHLAAPIAGLPAKSVVRSVLDAFPELKMFVITPRTQYDPGLDTRYYQELEDEDDMDSTISCLRTLHDKRLYFLSTASQNLEDFLLRSWKVGEFNIWNCARTTYSD